jgi:hypothetical protein
LIASFISNRVIQGFRLFAEGGTPLGYSLGMITKNRRAWSLALVAEQPAGRFLTLA